MIESNAKEAYRPVKSDWEDDDSLPGEEENDVSLEPVPLKDVEEDGVWVVDNSVEGVAIVSRGSSIGFWVSFVVLAVSLVLLGLRTIASTEANTVSVGHGTTEKAEMNRPPLNELVGDLEKDVRADVQFLMDFAIIGHSKCSTTFHMDWIRKHKQVLMYHHEVHSLRFGRPAEMVSYMYSLPEGDQYKRGYKAPNDIRTPDALAALNKYWPKTRLIVGLRHPVKWFESFYNFHTRQGGKDLDPAETMIDDNLPDHIRFHQHLSLLGKTNVLDPTEVKLLDMSSTKLLGTNRTNTQLLTSNAVSYYNMQQPARMTNPVFLFEVSQPFDKRDGRDDIYRKDLSKFLGLSTPIDPIPPENRTSPNLHYAIDICEDKYKELRRQLIETGKNAAEWIITYFLPLPDVVVSSPEHFTELLNTWSTDPCDKY